MKKTLFFVTILAAMGVVTSSAQTTTLIGAYQSCEMACQTIQIRSDHTFERVLDGDLFNDERTLGRWVYLGNNRIKAIGPKPSGAPKVTETSGSGKTFRVVVTDFAGAVLSGAKVAGIADGKSFHCITTDNDGCEIPACDSFTITRQHYSERYTVQDPLSRDFLIELSNEQMPNDVIDDVWVIKNGVLYWERDGKIDDYGLEKISRKKELKIFGPTSPKT